MNSKCTHAIITLVISVLCLAIFSTSVFAVPTNSWQYQLFYSYQDVYDSSGENRLAQVLYELNASDPYVYQLDTDREVKQWNAPGTSSSGSGAYTAWTWDESSDVVYASDITVYARIANQTDETISLNRRYFRISIGLATFNKSSSTSNIMSNPPWSMGSSSGCYVLPERQYFYLFMEDQYITNNRLVLTPGQTLTCTFTFTVYYPVQRADDAFMTWYNTYYIGIVACNYETALQARYDPDIATYNPYYNIYSILDAYKQNASNINEVTSGAGDVQDQTASIHDQEQQWYQQNSQAIESTGLSNFEFTTEQTTGLQGVFSLFSRLWSALGDYTFVYTFTLLAGLVVLILRHKPSKPYNNYYVHNEPTQGKGG